ncbi:hypothetical protein RAS1_39210 [Phycisphaerae bacterium RAS1]|nr:hypothetical protein RAS1_39210 [Phycisphaerae bacterium RAS1]
MPAKSITRALSAHPRTIVSFAALLLATAAVAEPVVFARHLALSPDGQTLAFSWAGDIWSVPLTGGAATRLTAHPEHDTNPVWSRDGRLIAFASGRHGAASVFVMNRDGSDVRRLTFGDKSEIPTDWSPDDKFVYFHSRKEGQVFWDPKVYRVSIDAGQPTRVMECHAADARVSGDGKKIVFARGNAPWWRRGYRGSAAIELWMHDAAAGSFAQLTTFDGNDSEPSWDLGARGVYFLSDRGGTVNVWHQPTDGPEAKQVTRMTDDDVRDYAVSADGKTLVFTHWDRLYVMSLPDGPPRALGVTAGGDTPRSPLDLRTFARDADEAEASPDGKEIALVVHGELFVIKTEAKRPTRRVTSAIARERDVTWSPDGKALFFVSDQAGQEDLYRATSAETPPKALCDSLRFKIERVTDNADPEFGPQVSPDGKHLAFSRLRGDLIVRELKSGTEQVLVQSWNQPSFRWSPDSKWIAYEIEDAEYNADIHIIPADGTGPAVNITRHPDNDGSPQWSADGQMLAFGSRRVGSDFDLYMVFLSPQLDQKSPSEMLEYFEKAAEKAKKRKPLKKCDASGKIVLAGEPPQTQPASQPESSPSSAAADSQPAAAPTREESAEKDDGDKDEKKEKGDKKDEDKKDDEKKEPEEKFEYELDTAWKRIRRVTSLPGDQSGFALSPDGGLLAFTSAHEGEPNLYQVKWNGEELKKALGGAAGGLHWGLDGQRLFYLKTGVPNSCKPGGADANAHDFRAKMNIDLAAEAAQKFDDAARALLLRFYHPTMKGLDWSRLAAKYRELALKTHTTFEFNEVFNMLQGELNASHMGISGPAGGGSPERIGYLGVFVDQTWPGPGLKIASIVRQGPADRSESRLYVGDVLLKVGGVEVGPDAPLDRALINAVDDPIILEIQPSPERPKPATQPSSSQAATAPASSESGGTGVPPVQTPAGTGETPVPPIPATPPTSPMDPGGSASQPDGADKPIEIVIRPISGGQFDALQYDAWVEANRKYVEEKSAGRLGYLHIRGMGEPEFHVFERDLYAAANGKEGLIIDVRNNGGGWTADWVMAVLSVKRHAYTIGRGGAAGYPQDRLIFYAWTKPTTMMCNQYSYSNAEIISHAFKTLKRGPLVGMTTFGAVISTGAYRLIDGASIRMPGRGWYLPDGTDMENHGAKPDVIIAETPADEAAGRQPQLDAAIQATLKKIADTPGGP